MSMDKWLNSPFVPAKLRNEIKEAYTERVVFPFKGEDGLVHLVIAEYETLCELVVNTRTGPRDYGFVFGQFVSLDTLVTCMGCLAEERGPCR